LPKSDCFFTEIMPHPQKIGAMSLGTSGNRTGWPSALSIVLVLAFAVSALAAPPRPSACTRVELTGKVNAGQEWKASLGEGWIFRVVPIAPGTAGYTGWDLVVDRDPPAGFPDALLLATPPYNSINEREIGTTYGLRAQDAIGWNPRSFRFLINPADFLQGQKLFLALSSQLQTPSGKAPAAGSKPPGTPSNEDPALARLTRQLMDLQSRAAAGEFHILDAGLAPGIADPEPFAQNWALRAARMQTTLVPPTGSKPTPRGELDWMHFTITLWLPAGWKPPHDLSATPAPCAQ
jgi:hypothetical protein